MSYISEDMKKSLVALIDETMDELEDLKKSRFSASEIKIEGPGKGIDGKPSDGSLETKKADDEDEDKKDEDKKEDDDMDKAEGKNREADPNGGKHQPVAKGDDMEKEEDCEKAEGKNREADPNGGKHQPVAKADDEKEDDKDEDEDEDKKDEDKKDMKKSDESESDLKKSIDESQELMKSYVDQRFSSFEEKLEKMFSVIQDIADAPVPAKGASYKDVTPLQKSADAGVEPMSKSQVIEKLFELKKSGTPVDTLDITSAELGNPAELAKIADKYSIN
jgi:hypothetical protein